MTEEEKYIEFINIVCETLGFNKPIDILKLCQKTSEFIRPYEMKIKELEQEKKANCIKMLKDWENLVCVGLSEGCCPYCEECLFGELKEQTEKKGIERL